MGDAFKQISRNRKGDELSPKDVPTRFDRAIKHLKRLSLNRPILYVQRLFHIMWSFVGSDNVYFMVLRALSSPPCIPLTTEREDAKHVADY